MGERLIELWNMDGNYFGIILLTETDFVWTNQVGGIACLHPRAKGIYIPLPLSWLPDVDPFRDFVYDEYDPEAVKSYLDKNEPLRKCFASVTKYNIILEIMEEETLLLAEAWIPVEIINNEEPIAPFMVGSHGILTYINSD